MTKAEIRRNRIKSKKVIADRVRYGDAKKMARTIDKGGTGYYYTTLTRFIKVDDSFWSNEVAAAVIKWLDERDEKEKDEKKTAKTQFA